MNQYRCDNGCYFENHRDKGCPIWEIYDKSPYKERCGWNWWMKHSQVVSEVIGCASHSDFQNQREKVLVEYNDFLLTKLVQELAGTWRMRDEKLFSIIRKYRRVPIGAMKAEPMQSKDGEP